MIKENKELTIRIDDLCRRIYFLIAGLYTFGYIIGSANFSNLGAALMQRITNFTFEISVVVLAILTIINFVNISVRKIIFIAAGLPAVLCIISFSSNQLILPFLFITAYPNSISLKKLSLFLCKTMLIATAIIIILCILGIFPDNTSLRVNVLRHSLGFITPNAFGNTIILAFFLKIFGSWDNWKVKDTIFWVVLTLVTYFYANSRASFYLSIFILILLWIHKNRIIPKKIEKIVYDMPVPVFLICLVLSIGLTIYFSKNQNNLYYFYNNLFSGRPYYLIHFYNNYGIQFFGHKNIYAVGYADMQASNGFLQWMGIDNSYVFISIYFGVFYLVYMFIIYFFAWKNVKEKKNWGGIIYLTLLAIMGLTENYMHTIALNFVFYVFADYLMNHKIE